MPAKSIFRAISRTLSDLTAVCRHTPTVPLALLSLLFCAMGIFLAGKHGLSPSPMERQSCDVICCPAEQPGFKQWCADQEKQSPPAVPFCTWRDETNCKSALSSVSSFTPSQYGTLISYRVYAQGCFAIAAIFFLTLLIRILAVLFGMPFVNSLVSLIPGRAEAKPAKQEPAGSPAAPDAAAAEHAPPAEKLGPAIARMLFIAASGTAAIGVPSYLGYQTVTTTVEAAAQPNRPEAASGKNGAPQEAGLQETRDALSSLNKSVLALAPPLETVAARLSETTDGMKALQSAVAATGERADSAQKIASAAVQSAVLAAHSVQSSVDAAGQSVARFAELSNAVYAAQSRASESLAQISNEVTTKFDVLDEHVNTLTALSTVLHYSNSFTQDIIRTHCKDKYMLDRPLWQRTKDWLRGTDIEPVVTACTNHYKRSG